MQSSFSERQYFLTKFFQIIHKVCLHLSWRSANVFNSGKHLSKKYLLRYRIPFQLSRSICQIIACDKGPPLISLSLISLNVAISHVLQRLDSLGHIFVADTLRQYGSIFNNFDVVVFKS